MNQGRGPLYLYGIVEQPPQVMPVSGVGRPPRPVQPVTAGGLTALVSRVAEGEVGSDDVRALRRDMKAHADVLNRLAADTTVLPCRFGIVMDQQTLVDGLLTRRRPQLQDQLARVDGAVELSLRAAYVEERALAEVVREQPRLVAAGGGRDYGSKIALGRKVAAALEAKRQREADELLGVLSPFVREIRLGKSPSDLTVVSAALLVDRKALPRFDRALEKLSATHAGRLQLDCVGPLPPYSFVDLRL